MVIDGGRILRAGQTRVRRFLRSLAARTAPPVILLYHRVADVESDPWGLAVSPANFRDQMRVLRDRRLAISLDDLARALAADRLPAGKVCITFDDGYADNLLIAKPILEELEIPAAFFLTSGYLQGARNFWWDALEQPFFQRRRIPATFELALESGPLALDLAEDAEYRVSAFAGHRQWRAWDPPPSRRHAAYHEVWQALHRLPGPLCDRLVETVQDWASVPDPVRPDCRPLSAAQVRQLAVGSLVEIGGHSVTHPALPVLDREGQRTEIVENKRRLEELIGRPVRHFAYPHGEFTDETVALVEQAGYESACTSKPGGVERGADPFRLPRMCAQDWNRNRFLAALGQRFVD